MDARLSGSVFHLKERKAVDDIGGSYEEATVFSGKSRFVETQKAQSEYADLQPFDSHNTDYQTTNMSALRSEPTGDIDPNHYQRLTGRADAGCHIYTYPGSKDVSGSEREEHAVVQKSREAHTENPPRSSASEEVETRSADNRAPCRCTMNTGDTKSTAYIVLERRHALLLSLALFLCLLISIGGGILSGIALNKASSSTIAMPKNVQHDHNVLLVKNG